MRLEKMITWMLVLGFCVGGATELFAAKKAPLFEDIRYVPDEHAPELVLYFRNLQPKSTIREIEGGKQVVIEIQGGEFPAVLTRKIDTSAIPGPVLQIVPYNTGGSTPGSKVLLQLRDTVQISQHLERGELRFLLKGNKSKHARKYTKEKIAGNLAQDSIRTKSGQILREEDESTRVAKELVATLNTPKAERIYKGTKVSIEASGVRVHDVFRLVGAASNLNIVSTSEVGGTVDLSLKDVPWDQVLDIVLSMQRLKATAVGNVVRITTIENFSQEQDAEISLKLAEQKAEPVVMAIVPVNYAKADEIRAAVSALLVGATGNTTTQALDERAAAAALGAGGATATTAATAAPTSAVISTSPAPSASDSLQVFARGRIEVDERTNSLLITHTEKQVERIRKLVKELDVPTPQILIEAKILNASEQFSRSVGVSWGGIFRNDTAGQSGGAGFGVNGFDSSVTGFSVTGPNPGASLGFKLGGGDTDKLQLSISLAETDNLSKTIAAPRLIVNNKQAATITSGTRLAVLTQDNDGGSADVTTEFVEATLSLQVTPQVTNSGFVLMDVSLTQDSPASGGNIDTRNITTQVLVESGSTLVLGGVYDYSKVNDNAGVPVLKDLPFFGQLFSTKTDSLNRNELLMFISPRVIEAAVTEDGDLSNEGVTL